MELNDYIKHELTHSIHTSGSRSFRGCRRRWHWIHIEGWYPQKTEKPLEFGVAYHKAMEVYYDPETWHDRHAASSLALVTFKKTIESQRKAYQQKIGYLEPEEEEDYKERLELGLGMLRYYFSEVSPIEDQNFTPYRVEIEFEAPIRDPDGNLIWCKCDNCWRLWVKHHGIDHFIDSTVSLSNESQLQAVRDHGWAGLPVTHGGRIDCLAMDIHGRFWVVDWKTAAKLSGEGNSSDDFMLLDDQITRYCWALWSLGIDIAGFIYHEQKKAYPLEPEPNKVRRKGCLYSVNKQQDTSYEIYKRTVEENDPEGFQFGAYEDFLCWLKESGPTFYNRRVIHRNEAELRNAGYNLWLEALDMTDPNLRIYPSAGRFSCTTCAFRQPCLGKNRDEDYMYTLETLFDRRDHRYWKQMAPSTDSKGGQ